MGQLLRNVLAVVSLICKYGRNIYILCGDTVSQICKEGSDVLERGYLGCVLLLEHFKSDF